MKKILSFVLVLAMVLGSVSMVFATDYSDVADTASCAEAVNVLSAVGVIEGYPDGTFKPGKTITRAEAIKIVVAALGLPVTEGASYPTQFTDVPATAWYAGYVRYGVALGITQGTTATTFRPDWTVTYDQMITFIMRALGYDDRLVGGYPAGYIMRAYQEGILEAGMGTGNAGAPRGEIAQMLYNALNKRFVAYDKDTDTYVAATPYGVGKTDMYALLGNEEDPIEYVVGDTLAVDASNLVNLSEYLGAKITVIRDTKDSKIVGIGKVLSEYVTGSTKAASAAAVKFGDYAQKSGGASVAAFAGFKNGVVDGGVTVPSGSAKTSDIYAVVIKDGKVAEIVSRQTWDVAQGAVGKYDGEELKLGDANTLGTLLGKSFIAQEDNSKAIELNSFALEGVKSLSDIKKGNVVFVYTAIKGGSQKITKVRVSDEVIEGKVTRINSDKDTFTIAGEGYGISVGANTADVNYTVLDGYMQGGNTIKVFLDPDGDIFSIEEVTGSTSTMYGILLRSQKKGGGIEETPAKAQIFTQDGKAVIYEMVSALNATSDSSNDIIGGTVVANQGELVKFKLNDKNQIKDVEAAVSIPGSSTLIGKEGLLGTAFIDGNTVAFAYDGGAIDKAASYSVIEGKTLNGQNIQVAYVDGTSSTKVGAALVPGAGIVKENENYVIFTGYAEIKDGYDITVWGKDGKANYTYKGAIGSFKVPVTTGASSAYTLSFNASNEASIDKTANGNAVKVTKISVSGSQAVINDVAKQVKADIVVYTKDGSNWTVSTGSSALTNAKDATLILIDTNVDSVSDIAIIIK